MALGVGPRSGRGLTYFRDLGVVPDPPPLLRKRESPSDHLAETRRLICMIAFLPLAQAAAENGPAGFFFGLGIFGLIVALVLGAFWLWMLIDALSNPTLEPTMKIVWGLLIFFLPFVGAVAYFFVARKRPTGS
jgi:hypothetical protein